MSRWRTAYRERIVAAAGPGFTPLMTCYLTDDTDPDELARGFEEGVWVAAKLYPAGATTNSAQRRHRHPPHHPALERMERIGMVLCVHGEVTDPEIDVFDREAVFIDRVLKPLSRDFPASRSCWSISRPPTPRGSSMRCSPMSRRRSRRSI